MQRGKPAKILELLVIVAVVLGLRALSVADTLGAIVGTITGGGGATVTAVSNCGSRSTRADAAGRFTLSGLAPCTYVVTVVASGHAAQSTSVTVGAGSTSSIAIALATSTPPPPPRPTHHHRPAMVMPSPVASTRQQPIEQDPSMNTENYARIDENPFYRTQTHPLSTFSADVDTASYANTRRFLRDGALPPKDAVRVEEMINYFRYALPPPPKDQPFSITTEVGPSPWNPTYRLVRIGLQTAAIDDAKVPPRNLTFLIDVSGSMFEPTKLPLLKRALGLLVETLRPQDKVAMVVYAGNTGLVLPPTSGLEKNAIRNALAALEAGGSTNGGAGIQLAYATAQKSFIKGGINRVILCTDGDWNVGTTSEGDLTRMIEDKREHGVFLTVLGFGMGNLKDSTMEKLADRGNGNYAYIDSIDEARKVLVKEAGATLVTVAKDVKLQVEFNPAQVAGYRLIGYEKRLLHDEDFNDDKKDAGDLGAGHSVTALYELVPVGVDVPGAKVDSLKYQTPHAAVGAAATTELMTVKVRYKAPDGATSKLLSQPVAAASTPLAKTSIDFRWAAAVAGYAMMLRESPNRGGLNWAQVASLAEGAVGPDAEGYRHELVKLIGVASQMHR